MSKFTWKVAEAPTGRYRSFQNRMWPAAQYVDGKPAAQLYAISREPYHAGIRETTTLVIRVADHSVTPWQWRQLAARPVGVNTAKALFAKFLLANPHMMP